jgi:hypothetical protein
MLRYQYFQRRNAPPQRITEPYDPAKTAPEHIFITPAKMGLIL